MGLFFPLVGFERWQQFITYLPDPLPPLSSLEEPGVVLPSRATAPVKSNLEGDFLAGIWVSRRYIREVNFVSEGSSV